MTVSHNSPFSDGPLFVLRQMDAAQNLVEGLSRYAREFFIPSLLASVYFGQAELNRLNQESYEDPWTDWQDLMDFNLDLFVRFFSASMKAAGEIAGTEFEKFHRSVIDTLMMKDPAAMARFLDRQFAMIEGVGKTLPEAVQAIEPEYGFHFERGTHPLVAETDRFLLYRVAPTCEMPAPAASASKPVIIVPPFVLGSNILCFLPGEHKSYVHCFADQGIPTYIRIAKNIHGTPACQSMTMEDDAMDTLYFCETVMGLHGRKVTLNGYCQGGFSVVCNVLSGILDPVVDALITCVAPMDGTRSVGLGNYLNNLPPRFNNLIYGTKTLAGGKKVADGQLMGWVYKLKSIEQQAPLVSFFRDMTMVARAADQGHGISKTAAALNYWLQNERTDIPLAITEMSFKSYTVPVTEDGTLPVTLFGNPLRFQRIAQKKIPWLLCYGQQDDLVEPAVALAPLDYIDVEVTPFPKGHVAIATSWSHPESACALHTRFGPDRCRGPVRFQLDLDKETSA